MSLFAENKKQYLFVMAVEFTVLSCMYWLLFNFKFSSFLVYILCTVFYFTMYGVWIKIFERKEHLLFHPIEKFFVTGIVFLSFVLAVNAYINPIIFPEMFCVYVIIFLIFISYYLFRLKKQKKSSVSLKPFSSELKLLTVMCGIFLLFDLIVFVSGSLNLQLILYLPFLFLILSFIVCVYKKYFKFNSFSSLILFLNVYITATLMLVLNFISFNFFSFTVMIHFIIFAAAVFVMIINSVETEDNGPLYDMKIVALIFLNIILIFVALNNLPTQIPDIFASYLHFVSIIIISFLSWKNYKIL